MPSPPEAGELQAALLILLAVFCSPCWGELAALLASLGMTPADALAAGSSAARAYLGRPGFVPGAPADLVTYHDDPRNDPAVIKQPAAIIRHGTRIK